MKNNRIFKSWAETDPASLHHRCTESLSQRKESTANQDFLLPLAKIKRELFWFFFVLVIRNSLVTLMPTKTQITDWQVDCTSRKGHNKQYWSLLDPGVFTTGESGKYCSFFSFPSENSLSTSPAVQQCK